MRSPRNNKHRWFYVFYTNVNNQDFTDFTPDFIDNYKLSYRHGVKGQVGYYIHSTRSTCAHINLTSFQGKYRRYKNLWLPKGG